VVSLVASHYLVACTHATRSVTQDSVSIAKLDVFSLVNEFVTVVMSVRSNVTLEIVLTLFVKHRYV
jgi:hypothetical protein